MEDEIVWLSLKEMMELFQREKSVISRHIKNVFEEGELDPKSVAANYATAQNEGGRRVQRQISYYNLGLIIELIALAKEINEAEKRGESTGLTPVELASYDALADNESAREIMGEDILKQIARDLTASIKNNISVGWAIRESVQAKMKMTIKRLLKKYGYPPDATRQIIYYGKLITETELQQITSEGDYLLFHRGVEEMIESGLLSPVKALGSNGRIPPLFNKYRIIRPREDYAEYMENIRRLNPRLNIPDYLKRPELYKPNLNWTNVGTWDTISARLH